MLVGGICVDDKVDVEVFFNYVCFDYLIYEI